MKKFLCLALAVLMLTGLAGCKREEPELTFPKWEEPETTAAPDTEPVQTAAAETVPAYIAPETHVISELAVEDYMLPLEEHSWDRQYAPEYVMLHFTSAVVNNRREPFSIAAVREIFYGYDVSIHYIIERDGTIHCYIPEDRVAWHAGYGTFADDPKYTDKMNYYAIGIELMAIGSQEDMSDYLTPDEYAELDPSFIGFTDDQYAALHALVADICRRNGIPCDRAHVIGHSDFTHDNHDPGQLLDWSRVLG